MTPKSAGRPTKPPTIYDVAAVAGVSKSTVSNVLQGKVRADTATLRRVQEAIAELGYQPSAGARYLRQHSHVLGVPVGDLKNPFHGRGGHRRLDICVANAGAGKIDSFVDGSRESWMSVIDVNLIGVMLTLQAAAREMIERAAAEDCPLLPRSPVFAGQGHAPSTAYATSKAAVMALMRAVACEFAQNRITANAVAPGQIETVLNYADVEVMSTRLGRDPQEFRTEFLDAAVPLCRMAEPARSLPSTPTSLRRKLACHWLDVPSRWRRVSQLTR